MLTTSWIGKRWFGVTVAILALMTRASLVLAQADLGGSAPAADTSGFLASVGQVLVQHFGPIGLVFSAFFFAWLLYKIRTYERARKTE